MAEIKELQQQIRNVANARAKLQEVVEDKREAMAKWEAENAELISTVTALSENKDIQENRLRELTLQVYAETGNKKPCEGVAIREITRLEYEPKDAYEWAVKHAMCLQLDKKAFEKVAQIDTPDFVEITKEAQATIATDLTEVIK